MRVQKSTARLLLLTLCVVFCASAAKAQDVETVPAPTRPEPVTPAVKRNQRPAVEPGAKPEPFDKATVEQMSKQCVMLSTEEGEIEIEFFPDAAPESVRNFLNLSAIGAYDTTVFSRVIKGFIIQGGDLTTRETKTPALMLRAARHVPDEPSAIKHVRGIVSMARADTPDSATTHFFILAGDGAHLDGTFSAFGRVRSGMDVVDKINNGELDGDKPKKPVRINRAKVGTCSPPLG